MKATTFRKLHVKRPCDTMFRMSMKCNEVAESEIQSGGLIKSMPLALPAGSVRARLSRSINFAKRYISQSSICPHRSPGITRCETRNSDSEDANTGPPAAIIVRLTPAFVLDRISRLSWVA